jgi:hypothetical protein
MKIRTGVTIATMRVLPKVIRCYKCNEIEHMANKCTIRPDNERWCKCGAMSHTITNCSNAPKSPLCSKGSEIRTSHVMGSPVPEQP